MSLRRDYGDFVYRFGGDDLPKQHVSFVGKRSVPEHTEKLIPVERLYTAVAREHPMGDFFLLKYHS